MPFPLKIQPVDFSSSVGPAFLKPMMKSRLKKLFERPFGNVLRITGPEKPVTDGGNDRVRSSNDDSDEFEPSSVCLGNMVNNFIEEGSGEQPKCSKTKCYCNNKRSDDELDARNSSTCRALKKLLMCSTVSERNLLADTAKFFEKNKLYKCKVDEGRKSVTEGLIALGYDASICKSSWGNAFNYTPGEHEYIDVIKGAERIIVDIDFRSEFEIARAGCTKKYNAILQVLPQIFVGKADRLDEIISLVSDAAKESLKKNRMPLPPWRTADYIKSKWLSPYTREAAPAPGLPSPAPAPQQQSVTPPLLTIMDYTDLASDIENLVIDTEETDDCTVIAGVSPASSDNSDSVFSLSDSDEEEEEEEEWSFDLSTRNSR